MAFIHKITRPLGPIAADGRYHDDQRGRASEPGDGSPDRGDHLAGARPEGAGR
ncbi:hypothetical protein [Microbispora triticiradicis]|uniref:hypothetical protein n=1 Tax=Microbispora TaxID=2005 RepID=UPI00140438CD|nr:MULTISPECIES: hypothetical protein [Microbispora]